MLRVGVTGTNNKIALYVVCPEPYIIQDVASFRTENALIKVKVYMTHTE